MSGQSPPYLAAVPHVPETQAASMRRCHGEAQLQVAQKDGGCTPAVPTGEHSAGRGATAKAVLVTAQTRAKLTLVIII